MSKIRRRTKIDNEIEKRIVTGAIVNDFFLKTLEQIYSPQYFKIDYANIVITWCLEYFKEYKSAPHIQIEAIYQTEKEGLNNELAEVIMHFLESLSNEHEPENFNVEYLITATRKYFDIRSYENLFLNGSTFVEAGKIEKARNLLDDFKTIAQKNSSRFDPFDKEEIRDFIYQEKKNKLFRFQGAAGHILGDFERDWLITFRGPEKRGKTFYLLESAFQAVSNKLKVVFFSLEMSDDQLKKRIYQRLTGLSEEADKLRIPIFDCERNQNNECRKSTRNNQIEFPDEYEEGLDYKVCTHCRGKRIKIKYLPAVWYDTYKTKSLSSKRIEKKADQFIRMFGNNLRIKTWPAFSANSNDIRKELDDLEFVEGFIPDVIIIDYIDILSPEGGNLSERGEIDNTWKQFKNISMTRHCLLITADQSNKISGGRRSIKATDVSEDKRKNAHVDMVIAINQTDDEKESDVSRLGILLHRHSKFEIRRQVLCLQNLEISQPLLDSEVTYVERETDEE